MKKKINFPFAGAILVIYSILILINEIFNGPYNLILAWSGLIVGIFLIIFLLLDKK